ncbi:MAG TPA: endonuclease/exonuclease/phosphatase family protein [Candidatus Synoicihabitans sp.]|nr:endonuclease/exonuclease/phosphatase family protein [Candidatus Synoicihabitans sp.]
MQRLATRLVLTLGVCWTASLRGAELASGSQATEGVLRVATYNIRYASSTPPHAWPERRPLLRAQLAALDADIIGTQEGLYSQLRDIAADLPEYDWIGLGRGGGSRDEFVAVFYRRDRMEPLEYDHFWLSDTPEMIGSNTWGPRFRRMVTWVTFRDRKTQQVVAVWNTHFDHEVQVAREKGARLIRERLSVAGAEHTTAVLVGDFNAAPTNPIHAQLTAGGFLRDAWDEAPTRDGEGGGTFNGFGEQPDGGDRIDWILVRGSIVVDAIEIVHPPDEVYPSDHYPVVATLRWSTSPGSIKGLEQ